MYITRDLYIYIETLLLSVCCVYVSSSNVDMTNFRTFDGYKVKDEFVIEQHLLPQIPCFSMCSSTPSCRSVSWNSVDYTCLLTNKKFIVQRDEMSDASSNWIMASTMNYQVFIARGEGGRYTLPTFADGVNKCLSIHAVIADPEDLVAARTAGYNACNCGWLSNGQAGFVLQNPDGGCWYHWSENVLYCGNNFNAYDVYCKLPHV